MVLVYCILDISTPGGTERTLLVQASYFAEHGYDVHIVTTEDIDSFYPFYKCSERIKFHCLHINYKQVDGVLSLKAITQRLKLGIKHKKALSKLLYQIKPDFTFTMFGHELSFLYKIKDGSRKISQFHFSKDYKLIESRHSSMSFWEKVFMLIKDWRKKILVKKYDAFIVLTNEDAKNWGNLHNMFVIPNAVPFMTEHLADCNNKKIISVGRLAYQKGYDIMIDVWKIVNQRHSDWKFVVYGAGEDYLKLKSKIVNNGLQDSFIIESPVNDIVCKYLESSIFVSSSRYEGLPMTLLEAMACGLPCVSFACPCGPSEIIVSGETGFVVQVGDIVSMADRICDLIENAELRKCLGEKASEHMKLFSVDNIMKKWVDLLNKLSDENSSSK